MNYGSVRIKCCRECTERHLGCHGTCERYKAEQAEMQASREEIRKQKEKDIPYENYKFASIDKMRKAQKRKNKR